MDITPIYDLRDRLRAAMIAGTNLLAEDFRLKRAVEGLAPLEKAAPVFAKVGELSRNLIAPGDGGTDGKEGLLLDAITLVDAVCCTQGAVGVAGELAPVFAEDAENMAGDAPAAKAAGATGNASRTGAGTVLSNVPYSTLQPLQEALTTSGSGHYSFVTECHQNNPELFKDYRVRAAMVQALGASYGELADNVCDWLLEDGADVVPLLMRGFDPKGKKEMVRRVQVIDRWMGAAANDFYIKQLETAEGELRQNLILALRHSPENIERLDGMRKTEKGKMKKAAYYALACNDDEKVQKLFEELYQKKPIDTMYFLHYSRTPWAAKLAAKGTVEQLLVTLEEQEKRKKAAEAEKDDKAKKGKMQVEAELRALDTSYIAAMENALFGKNGEAVCEAISSVAKHTGKFGSTLHESVLDVICGSLIRNPEEDLLALAVQLYEGEDGEMKYFPAAFVSRLISQGGDGMVDWLEAQLFGRKPVLPYHFLAEALRYLEYDDEEKKYCLATSRWTEVRERTEYYAIPVRLTVKGRFLELLMRCNEQEVDGKLARIFDTSDAEVCAKIEEYFYKKALERPWTDIYLYALRHCGCTRCEGLLEPFVRYKSKTSLSLWEIELFIRRMPGTLEAKMAEAAKLPELVKNGQVYVRSWNEEGYMDWVQNGL